MTLLELVNALKSEMGRSGGPLADLGAASSDDLRLVGWIRNKWSELEGKKWWSWQRKTKTDFALVDGVGVYPPATAGPSGMAITNFRSWWPESDEYRPFAYKVGERQNPVELRFVSYEVFRRHYLVIPQDPSSPTHWSYDPSGNLVIGPAPVGSDWRLTIDYRATPTALVADADQPAMPSHFHMLLVWEAMSSGASFDAAPEVLQRAQNEQVELWSQLVDECAPKMRLAFRPLA